MKDAIQPLDVVGLGALIGADHDGTPMDEL